MCKVNLLSFCSEIIVLIGIHTNKNVLAFLEQWTGIDSKEPS